MTVNLDHRESVRPPDVGAEHDAADAARRLSRFGETGDPSDLWPGLTESARVAASGELERVTRAVLAAAPDVRVDPTYAHEPYALSIAGHTSGMGPVIGRWIEDGTITAAPNVAALFASHLDHARRRAERMEREVLPALDALIERGITPLALKGFHTGHRYFGESGMRRMSDIDVLVPSDRSQDAEAALRHAGFSPHGPAEFSNKRDWISADCDPRLFSVELTDARSKWVLELHTSLDRHYHPVGLAALDRERTRIEPIEISGRTLLALSPAMLVVTLACHCSHELDGVRLLRLFELVQVIRRERDLGRLDWSDVVEILRRTDTAAYAYPAFALAETLAPGTVHSLIIAVGRLESTWAARHTVSRLAPGGGSLDSRSVLRQIMWTRGPVAITLGLLRSIWPSAGWRVRLRRLRNGVLSFHAPDERLRS